jgi:hypothetical protein
MMTKAIGMHPTLIIFKLKHEENIPCHFAWADEQEGHQPQA